MTELESLENLGPLIEFKIKLCCSKYMLVVKRKITLVKMNGRVKRKGLNF